MDRKKYCVKYRVKGSKERGKNSYFDPKKQYYENINDAHTFLEHQQSCRGFVEKYEFWVEEVDIFAETISRIESTEQRGIADIIYGGAIREIQKSEDKIIARIINETSKI